MRCSLRSPLFSAFVVAPLLLAQTGAPTVPAGIEPSDVVLRSSSREVLLDVVVRRRDKHIDRKLKASDFTITEDGVPETIKSFRLITGPETDEQPGALAPHPVTQQAPSALSAETPKRIETPSFVSIVFDELSPGSRAYARDAVQAFLKDELNRGTYVSVFDLNFRLNRLMNFTNDRAQVSLAVQKAVSSSGYTSLTAQNGQVLNQFDYSVTSTGGPTGGGISITPSSDPASTAALSTAGASTPNSTEGAVAAAAAAAEQRDIAMYQTGMRTVDGLLALVDFESTLPGRKTVLYISDGLNLPPGQKNRFFDVVSAANRANVSFYGIDARGLLPESPNSYALAQLASVAATSRRQQSWSNTGADEHMAKQDDSIYDMNVGNTSLNLVELSNSTGGFAIVDTNEIAKNMKRVMEDVRTHYEISYVPQSDVYDGHYRKIAVKVADKHLSVQTRDGYYALPDLDGKPLRPFEMPALEALDAKPKPADVGFHIAALRYSPDRSGASYEIAFSLPIRNLMIEKEPGTTRAHLHASFLALIKDSRGQVVEKVSREIDRLIPADKADAFANGEMIFTNPVKLAPGHYTVEAASVDAITKKAGVRRIAISVAPPGAMGLSDVALVRDIEPVPGDRDSSDPLQFAGGKVTPDLDGAAKAGQPASVYFVVYPQSSGDKPRVFVDFYRDGKLVARTEPPVDEKPGDNAVPMFASAKLPAGDYEARVTCEQNGHAVRRSAAITVAP